MADGSYANGRRPEAALPSDEKHRATADARGLGAVALHPEAKTAVVVGLADWLLRRTVASSVDQSKSWTQLERGKEVSKMP